MIDWGGRALTSHQVGLQDSAYAIFRGPWSALCNNTARYGLEVSGTRPLRQSKSIGPGTIDAWACAGASK
jgi:hypothetical protein